MTKKTIWIEIFPRALWVLKFILLVSTQYLFVHKPQLTDNSYKLILGIVLSAGGFVFWMSITRYMRIQGAFSSRKELCTAGPFQYIRHPMYVSVYIMLVGLGLLFFSWLWFVVLIVFVPIWYGVSKMEENHMTSVWKEQYLYYKRETGMFFPKLKLKEK